MPIPYPELISARDKVWSQACTSLENIVHAKSNYTFTNQVLNQHPKLGLHKGDPLPTKAFDNFDNVLFFEQRPENIAMYARILGRKQGVWTHRFIKRDYVREVKNSSPNFDKYKVFLPQAIGGGKLDEKHKMDYIGASIAGPSEAHTESSISIGSFDTEAEAEACTKYLKTKFVRAMQWIKKRTQNMRKTTWEFVPTQDFSPSSDIDWSQPIPDVDRQLYAKYGLNEEEIAFIENNVKEME